MDYIYNLRDSHTRVADAARDLLGLQAAAGYRRFDGMRTGKSFAYMFSEMFVKIHSLVDQYHNVHKTEQFASRHRTMVQLLLFRRVIGQTTHCSDDPIDKPLVPFCTYTNFPNPIVRFIHFPISMKIYRTNGSSDQRHIEPTSGRP